MMRLEVKFKPSRVAGLNYLIRLFWFFALNVTF